MAGDTLSLMEGVSFLQSDELKFKFKCLHLISMDALNKINSSRDICEK